MKRALNILKHGAVLQFLLVLWTFLAYWPTLSGEFILDDRPLIQKNPYVMQRQSIVSYLSQEDGKPGHPGETGRTGYYRPLLNFTYWLDYRLWGMEGACFRLSNLICHLLTVLLFFHAVKRLSKDRQAAFWLAALFALHPVHTEAVSWVSSRNNILAALFGLGSFLLYQRANETGRAGYGSLSLLFFAGALLSKEFGIALLPIFLVWAVFLGREEGRGGWGFVRDHLPYLVVLCGYLVLRSSVTGLQPAFPEEDPLWRRVFFAPYLALVNTQKILFPAGLHSLMVGYPPGVISWQGAAGISFTVSLGLLWWLGKGRPLFRFGLLSFLISLGPILHLVPLRSPSLVSMRWLYFPSIFLLIAVSPHLSGLLSKKRAAATGLLVASAFCLGSLTHVLNRGLWNDEETFFRQEVYRFGNDYYAGGLAELLHLKGDHKGAEEQFLRAIHKGHHGARELINYGALLIERGRPVEALPVLERGLGLPMSFEERAELHNNLGTAEHLLGQHHKSVSLLKKAVAYDPGKPLFWSNLGSAYGAAGEYREAVEAFGRALELEPRSCEARKGIAITLMNMQDCAGAIAVLEGAGGDCDRELASLLRECLARARSACGGRPGKGPSPPPHGP